MVSTRQMSTAGGPNANNVSNDDVPSINTRLSVITRQSSSGISSYATTSSLSSSAAAAIALTSSVSSTTTRSSASSPTTLSSNKHSAGGSTGVLVSATTAVNGKKILTLSDLPIEVLDKIFSYLTYKKVGQMRIISRQMNQMCSSILNSTFSKLQTQMLHRFQTVKAMMPRRESARRNHPLACECDIIETCYMRLSLLQMTFGKHIERKHCCFFPGGILDEVYYVLNYIRTTPRLERPFKVTDELFDLSTMAMEYFKDHIEPNLPEIVYFSKDFFAKSKQTFSIKVSADISDSSSSSPPQSNMVLRKGIRKIKQGMKIYNNQLTALRSELRTCKRKSSEQGKQIAEQQKLLADQQKQTLEYANRLDENDRKNEEMSRKFSTLLQELNKCKTELQYWRSKSPAVQVCTSCGHKMTPVVAPEEYQALVNQGIKPQDININLDDVEDCDTSSNVFSDLGLDNQSTSTEFVYPDEVTTAKLLASSVGGGIGGSNISDGTTATATSNSTAVVGGGASSGGSKRRHDGSVRSSTATTTSANMSIVNSDNNTTKTISAAGSGGGCNNDERGIIHSTILVTTTQSSALLSLSSSGGGVCNNTNGGPTAGIASTLPPSSSSSSPPSVSSSSSSLLSSNNLSSDTTKKARKVQSKGSRCHNTNKRNK